MKRFSKWMGVIIVLCCALGLSFPAQAESKVPIYLVLKGGIYSPQTNDLNGFKTGFNGEFAVGHYFDKNWAIEAATGQFQTSSNKGTMFGPEFSNSSVHLNVVPLTIAFKGVIPVNRFEFYGIGGAGAYFLQANIDDSEDSRNRRHDSDRDSDTVFGGFLGLGANFNVTPKWFFGVEGKYLWTTTATFRNGEANLNGILATLNFGYKF